MAPLNRRHYLLHGALVCWLALLSLLPASLSAKSTDPPRLEQAISHASLILVARVSTVGESKVVYGGKAERVIRTFEFEPVRPLKGIFVRDVLALTSDDLGNSVWAPQRGQLRLLLLGRSGTGYQNVHRRPTLDASLPVLDSLADPLLQTVELLIDVTQEPDRARKIELLLAGLQTSDGAGAIPLLDSLSYRALLAAQAPEAISITRFLDNASPEVRTTAAVTLGAILEADYLRHADLSARAVGDLVELLETSDPFVAARVAALEAIGVAHTPAAGDIAGRQLRLRARRATWAEEAAVVQAIGQRHLDDRDDEIVALVEDLRLDAAPVLERAALGALIRLDPSRAAPLIARRIDDKHLAGLDAAPEIELAGGLPVEAAVSVLAGLPIAPLSYRERIAFSVASERIGDERLIPALTRLLDPNARDVHWRPVDALRKIDTVEAAQAAWPYLAQEANLGRKLEIAELLARHGIAAGAAYAFEHLSQPHLLDPAIAVLVAVGSPESVSTLRAIVETSNDVAWTGAAIRALGALGDGELMPRLWTIVEDLRHPLAPYALVALGQLAGPEAVEIIRTAVGSRDDRIVAAGVRGAASLLWRGSDEGSELLRDDIAALLADADASDNVRDVALDTLQELEDPRLDVALAEAMLDAGLEGKPLLARIEELLATRKVRVTGSG